MFEYEDEQVTAPAWQSRFKDLNDRFFDFCTTHTPCQNWDALSVRVKAQCKAFVAEFVTMLGYSVYTGANGFHLARVMRKYTESLLCANMDPSDARAKLCKEHPDIIRKLDGDAKFWKDLKYDSGRVFVHRVAALALHEKNFERFLRIVESWWDISVDLLFAEFKDNGWVSVDSPIVAGLQYFTSFDFHQGHEHDVFYRYAIFVLFMASHDTTPWVDTNEYARVFWTSPDGKLNMLFHPWLYKKGKEADAFPSRCGPDDLGSLVETVTLQAVCWYAMAYYNPVPLFSMYELHPPQNALPDAQIASPIARAVTYRNDFVVRVIEAFTGKKELFAEYMGDELAFEKFLHFARPSKARLHVLRCLNTYNKKVDKERAQREENAKKRKAQEEEEEGDKEEEEEEEEDDDGADDEDEDMGLPPPVARKRAKISRD